MYNGDVWYMIPGFNGYEINEDKIEDYEYEIGKIYDLASAITIH